MEKEQIQSEIKALKDKLWDSISYISSDFCVHCSEVYDMVRLYEKKIKELESQLNQ